MKNEQLRQLQLLADRCVDSEQMVPRVADEVTARLGLICDATRPDAAKVPISRRVYSFTSEMDKEMVALEALEMLAKMGSEELNKLGDETLDGLLAELQNFQDAMHSGVHCP